LPECLLSASSEALCGAFDGLRCTTRALFVGLYGFRQAFTVAFGCMYGFYKVLEELSISVAAYEADSNCLPLSWESLQGCYKT